MTSLRSMTVCLSFVSLLTNCGPSLEQGPASPGQPGDVEAGIVAAACQHGFRVYPAGGAVAAGELSIEAQSCESGLTIKRSARITEGSILDCVRPGDATPTAFQGFTSMFLGGTEEDGAHKVLVTGAFATRTGFEVTFTPSQGEPVTYHYVVNDN